MKRLLSLCAVAVAVFLFQGRADAQHLWWNLAGQDKATCLYGEVTVLATHWCIYYCGANWHPGEAAGGYCGIQHNGPQERRTIFSIWDTSPDLHPRITEAGPGALFNRFGGEGTGSHTHMLWPWKEGETFQFFVCKRPGKGDTTDTRYYVYDRAEKKWLHSATITSPNGGHKSVATIGGGGLASFLENFAGRDPQLAKLALYRLWVGPKPEGMHCLTRAHGDGKWGQLGDAYFLAEGGKGELQTVFSRCEKKYGKPHFGGKETQLEPISDRPLSADLISALTKLPRAAAVKTP